MYLRYCKKIWCYKKGSVLPKMLCDQLDSPAVVIQPLSQADPFPCSVTSLGRTDLFKALDLKACALRPMATRNLAWATGKRKISASSHTFHLKHPLTKSVYRIYPDNSVYFFYSYTKQNNFLVIMGSNYSLNIIIQYIY